jgi:cytochrome P450
MATLAPPVTRLPPGPGTPPWAQTLQLLLRPEPFLEGARRAHGDVFTIRTAAFGTFVVVADPDVVREVFTGPPDVLLAGASNAPLSILVGERSVLVLDGPEHLRARKLLLPPFHGDALRSAGRLIERATLREVDGWPTRRPFALLGSMQQITLEVILTVVFGVRDAARFEQLATRLRAVLEPMGGRLRAVLSVLAGDGPSGGGPDARRFAARRAAVDELLFAEIAQRRQEPDLAGRDDVLSLLLTTEMDDQEVRDELVTLLLAGHETTATALAWTFERLLRTPHALAAVRAELDTGGTTYLDAVCKEALRARPVLPNVGRVLAAPLTLGGFRLPAGTAVLPSIALLHRRMPDPDAFAPERFLGDDAPSGYEWIPFGGGVRRCLGASFALTEMRTVVATVLRHADLVAVGAPEGVKRRGITLTPERGGQVRLRAR